MVTRSFGYLDPNICEEWNEMITKSDLAMLGKLKQRTQAGPVMSEQDIRLAQRLVGMGLARDHSAFFGHRTPVHLRMWGITDAGRAALEQKSLTAHVRNQMALTVRHWAPSDNLEKSNVTYLADLAGADVPPNGTVEAKVADPDPGGQSGHSG